MITRKLIGPLVGLLLGLAACAPAAPLPTLTPAPRTPRATLTAAPLPTATGTLMPTPAPSLGVYSDVFCTDPAPWSAELTNTGGVGLYGANQLVFVCAGAQAATVDVTVYALAGWAQAISAGSELQCLANCPVPPPDTTPAVTGGDSGVCHWTLQEYAGAVYLPPGSVWKVHTATEVSDVFCDTHYTTQHYSVAVGAGEGGGEPGGTPGPTPTLVATPHATPYPGDRGTCWISEVLPVACGVTCPDWNLRAGGGANDDFVEIACNPGRSLVGWQVCVGTDCYTVRPDN